MSDARPIGVFDSGIGGLTVVKALRDLLPNENVSYLGDTARVPYGNKSSETVERYSLELASMLAAENAKVIVVACNTVSSVSIPKLRANVKVPVVGVIEPGAQAAIATTRNRHVGVIGTRATIEKWQIKGIEALTLECFLAAARAGVVDEVAASMKNNYPGLDWTKMVPYNLERMASHGERRAAEMEESADTLRELGVEPVMTMATVKRQRDMGQIGKQQSVRGALEKDGPAMLGAISAAARDRH